MTIKKTVDFEIELDSKDIANAICDMWSDEQAQMLLEISKIVDSHSWQSCSQLYEVGRWVYESTTKEERKKVTEFIDMMREYITDFDKDEKSDGDIVTVPVKCMNCAHCQKPDLICKLFSRKISTEKDMRCSNFVRG